MKQSDIFAAYVDLVGYLKKVCTSQQETLDKIVGAQYDRPVVQHQPPPSDPAPQMMLFDQGDVRPDNEIERGMNALNIDSDADFLQSVQ